MIDFNIGLPEKCKVLKNQLDIFESLNRPDIKTVKEYSLNCLNIQSIKTFEYDKFTQQVQVDEIHLLSSIIGLMRDCLHIMPFLAFKSDKSLGHFKLMLLSLRCFHLTFKTARGTNRNNTG